LAKLDANLAGKEWAPSQPPPTADPQNRTSSPSPAAQTLRKSRTSARTATGRSASPSPFRGSPRGTPNPASDQKAANEAYFEGLGKANESRPDHLPPSQGGRYTGFGNTPTPQIHPLSSQAAPTLSELQENPLGAITKGWSLFSAAVVGASKAVSENVIQPGVEKITDPNFQANVKGYVSEAQKKAMLAGEVANSWSKQQFGVDVADSVGGVVGTVKDKIAGPSRAGYGALPMEHDEETSALYHDADEDNFFGEYNQGFQQSGTSTQTSLAQKNKASGGAAKKNDWDDDDWKDF
jgi:ADP-ribosylation factor GTPase-activating protein 1